MTGAATPGLVVPCTPTFGGSDFVSASLRVKFPVVTVAPTAPLWLFFQTFDAVEGLSTSWYPNSAVAAIAAFVTALSNKDPNGAPCLAGQVLLSAAPAATDRMSVVINGNPGATFRLAALVVGATANFTMTVQGDFRKWVPDNS